ncbi:MAG: DUF3298 domain-containing protein [Bacteroidales bacterium]|nr:DUF3298 domain-containing protein [Candidatus Sodaliphilus fimicaballi]
MKTNYQKHLISTIIVLSFSWLCISCNQTASNGYTSTDTVSTSATQKVDSTSYIKSNGEKCNIFADATIAVPTNCGNGNITELRKQFAKYVLDAPDSLSVDEALNQYMINYLKQYEISYNEDTAEGLDDEIDSDTIKTYNNSINISVLYNNKDVVTFSKVIVTRKNNYVSSVVHRYYNFDIKTGNYITLNNLFRDDAIQYLCQDFKSILMSENNVSSVDQLNEVGYFNIDNLTVNLNFFFDETGITWVYLPNELAIQNLGEPKIKITYSDLEPYLNDNSLVKRFN